MVSEPFCSLKVEGVFCLFGLLHKSNEASVLRLSHLFLGAHLLISHIQAPRCQSISRDVIVNSVLLPLCHLVYDNQVL